MRFLVKGEDDMEELRGKLDELDRRINQITVRL